MVVVGLPQAGPAVGQVGLVVEEYDQVEGAGGGIAELPWFEVAAPEGFLEGPCETPGLDIDPWVGPHMDPDQFPVGHWSVPPSG